MAVSRDHGGRALACASECLYSSSSSSTSFALKASQFCAFNLRALSMVSE